MDFSNDTLNTGYINGPMGILDNNASICNHEGSLLFYTNGRTVMNAHHEIIENGRDINDGDWARRYWPDPTRGFPGSQDIMILPGPRLNGGYYMLHKSPVYNPPAKDSIEIRYSYIEHNTNSDQSEVTEKNVKFYLKNDMLLLYLTAIRHSNQKDWWVLQPLLGASILTILINDNGIILDKTQSSHQVFDSFRSSASGTAKFSPDGTKYAIYNYYDQLQIYDFDRTTGTLSNHQKINIISKEQIDRDQIIFSSLEWSPNSRYIYTATHEYLHQVDLDEPDEIKKVVLIDTYNGTMDPFVTSFFLMAQGPDCKIYMCPKSGSYSLHVINKPDEAGKACDFVQNGIKLPNANGGSLPNFPRFRVDEIEKCNPGITSLFGEQVYYRRDLQVYPNPSSGLFYFKSFSRPVDCRLYVSDIQGKILFTADLPAAQIPESVDISHLPSGRYNIDIYPVENRERIFYGTQVVKI
ncbi:MAG: T9SS type A sorting domain-containing protein [Saprospiraceae bacterium]|nr:T9SS type A sorting domain-containing protein [Saprospiraceae bacterium]MBP6566984.1 T9SS type A sorting domain-containing protein [Saprospiraceae bacterium]